MTTIEELEATKKWYEEYFTAIYGGYIPNAPHHNTIRETLTQAIAIKKGDMVVVPREPDEKMICAAFEQCDGYNAKYYRDLYKAMIAAQEEK